MCVQLDNKLFVLLQHTSSSFSDGEVSCNGVRNWLADIVFPGYDGVARITRFRTFAHYFLPLMEKKSVESTLFIPLVLQWGKRVWGEAGFESEW